MAARWKNRPEGSNWGDFGPDDQRGRLNLLTPERVVAAAREVREGIRFCLSLPLDLPGGRDLNPRRFPPRRFSTERNGLSNYNFPLAEDNPELTDVVSDDAVLLCLQYSSQWDSFAHVGSLFDANGDGIPEIVYYNGWTGLEHLVAAQPRNDAADPLMRFEGVRAKALGIENMAQAGVQGRGVMIDLHRHLGDERTVVDFATLDRIMKEDGIVVEEGDMVCLHTGFGKMLVERAGNPDPDALHNAYPALDGGDPELQDWIRDSGLAVLVADNYAVEHIPGRDRRNGPKRAMMPLHELCLFKLGIHLGEIWYLTALAEWLHANSRSRFLLTAPPLHLPGVVGSPANAIATV
ncbi:cyclase [Thalassobaculum fulvum]|uniref:Cyclase n=1 Tax=Thalassobaculum fulvum TaxID=1633335 RepID=A0A918XWH0_9PROT|nr:cyclase family protein [Thalassobaculum fulvum]GHD58256.1 cyclase [Thalassobaculum fulvum]